VATGELEHLELDTPAHPRGDRAEDVHVVALGVATSGSHHDPLPHRDRYGSIAEIDRLF
jgi:hypothetical protein